jgi:hypothetical protein
MFSRIPCSKTNEPLAYGVPRQTCNAAEIKLLREAFAVVLNGLTGQMKNFGDLFGRLPFR